jgi:fermentation-respiration switch protein FrsA (DUF1100 family)
LEVTGTLTEDGDRIDAVLKQRGFELPLELRRTDEVVKVNRPQEPKRPFPYREEEVSYTNDRAGITIAGTLTLPAGEGPFPAALLISGSGAQDRDETVFGHKPFLVMADYLTRRGIAVLRVDDRGVGGTGGSLSDSTTQDLARDALAGVSYLRSRPEIDSGKVGLVGHSEGGLIAPLAAAESENVAFIVLMAGPGLPGEEILYLQSELISRAEGTGEEEIEKNLAQQRRIYDILKKGGDREAMEKTLRRMYEEDMAALSDQERKESELSEAQLEGQLEQLLSNWFRFFLTYDPRPTLERVRCPVLAVIGEKDLQVPPKENLSEIEKALKAGGNPDYTLKEFKGLNHMFQTAVSGAVTEYGRIEETMAPEALSFIGDWILDRMKNHDD